MTLPYETTRWLSVDESRRTDHYAIETIGLPGIVLMENAGRTVAEFIHERLAEHDGASRVMVLCGAGNNGGDGFVVARHLANAGVDVCAALAVPSERLGGDARANWSVWRALGHEVRRHDDRQVADDIGSAQVIVDALLGTGATGAPRGTMKDWVVQANAASAQRVAIDVPSGLDADTGLVHDPCFRADATLTMIGPKRGFSSANALSVLGAVVPVSIGVPATLEIPPSGVDS